jgi:cob(I)alamin adenosyltransferase
LPRRPDEPVRLDRIYTRGGDKGQTSLGDGSRVSKLDPLVEAYGDVDELNSLLGWAVVAAPDERLSRIQTELFDLGADLCVPFQAGDGKLRIEQSAIDRLEVDCDEANADLPELKSFILPGGSEAAARLHIARAVCRRAERQVLASALERPVNPLALVYLNRLSDLLFILARAANTDGEEPLWRPGGAR